MNSYHDQFPDGTDIAETKMNVIYTWRTTKEAGCYKGSVLKITSRCTPNAAGQYADTKVIKEVFEHTRALAKARAQDAVRALNFYKELDN